MPELTIEKRSDDYICYQTNNKAIWESGKTPEEAIGKWIISNFSNNLNLNY